MTTQHIITGNTYPFKDQLKAVGCKWDPSQKAWTASNDTMADKARAITSGVAGNPQDKKPFVHSRCKECGCAPSQYRPIYRSGVCKDCYLSEKEEREMGY